MRSLRCVSAGGSEDPGCLKACPSPGAIVKYNNGIVAFRWKARWTNTLEAGPWTHNLSFNYQSGYQDDPTSVLVRGTTTFETVSRRVAEYWTIDWQSRWQALRSSGR